LLCITCLQDLGEFTFKGISGSHSLMSMCTKALAGRSFPTTLRKAKGTQLTRGQGLLYQLHMQQPAAERASSLPSPSYSRHQAQQHDFQLAEPDTAAAAFVAERASSMPCPSYGRQQQAACVFPPPTWATNDMHVAAGVDSDGCFSRLPALQLDRTDAVAGQRMLAAGVQASLVAADATFAAAAAAAGPAYGSACVVSGAATAGVDGGPSSGTVTAEAADCPSRAGAQLQLSAAPSLTVPGAQP
jgi:hypothetical protein